MAPSTPDPGPAALPEKKPEPDTGPSVPTKLQAGGQSTHEMMMAMIKKTLAGALFLSVATLPGPADAASPSPPASAAAALAIVASLHLQHADATLAALRGYLPFPINAQDALKDLVGDFNKLVALSAPMDVVIALDPAAGENLERPLWGFAVGVTAAEDARLLAQSRGYLTDGKAGTYRLSVPVTSNGRGLFCYLTTLAGGKGRLSCSGRDRDRDLLGPYLGRLTPSAAAQAADIHGELLIDTLARTYAGPWQRMLQVGGLALPQRLALGQPKFDRAVTDATQALIGELLAVSHDLQTVALDISLQQSGAQLQLGYRMGGRESAWAQADAETAARPASGPPPAFWTLPSEVTAASYRTADAKWGLRLLQLAWPIVDGYFEHDGLAAADRQALGDLLLKIPKFEGPMTTVLAELPAAGPAASKGEEVAAFLGGTSYLVTADGQSDQSLPWLRALLSAYNRPGVQAYLKKKWRAAGVTDPLPTLRGDVVSKQLGQNAVALAFTANLAGIGKAAGTKLGSAGPGAAATARRGPTTVYIISAAIDNRVFTVLGTDRAALLRRLTELPKLPPEKTLAQRPGLDTLRRPGWQSGGFGTIAGFSTLLNLALASASRAEAGRPSAPGTLDAAALLAAIPHHGEVPHTYGGRPAAPGPQNPLGLTYLYAVQIPRLVLEDAVALVMNIALVKDK